MALDNKEDDGVRTFLVAGAQGVGAAAITGVGFALARPDAIVASGAIGIATYLFGDFVGRALTARQRKRAAMCAVRAMDEIVVQTIERPVREHADEVFEGVLMAAADSVEDGKLHPLARLASTFVSHPKLPVDEAHHVLQFAKRMTHRQLVLLKLVCELDDPNALRAFDYRKEKQIDPVLRVVLQQLFALYQEGWVFCLHAKRGFPTQAPEGYVEHAEADALLSLDDINPAMMRTTPEGNLAYDLLGLRDTIGQAEVAPLRALLSKV